MLAESQGVDVAPLGLALRSSATFSAPLASRMKSSRERVVAGTSLPQVARMPVAAAAAHARIKMIPTTELLI
jgi:hypothetical protein